MRNIEEEETAGEGSLRFETHALTALRLDVFEVDTEVDVGSIRTNQFFGMCCCAVDVLYETLCWIGSLGMLVTMR